MAARYGGHDSLVARTRAARRPRAASPPRCRCSATGRDARRQRRHVYRVRLRGAAPRAPRRWRATPRRRTCTWSWCPTRATIRRATSRWSDGQLVLDGAARWTYGNIALYRTALFAELPRRERLQMLPLYRDWIARGWASGERFTGSWANVGTPEELVKPRPAAATGTNRRHECSHRTARCQSTARLRRPAALRRDRSRTRRARDRRAARRCASDGRARRGAALRRRPGRVSSRRSPRRRIASTVPGDRSRISTRWSIRPRCARRTTPICPRSRRSTPNSGRTNGCLRGYRALAAAPGFRSARCRAAQADRERAARFPALRRRAGRRSQGALQGGRGGAGEPRRALRGQRARRDQRLRRSYVEDEASLRASPPTCSKRRRRRGAATAVPAASSRCACPAICR